MKVIVKGKFVCYYLFFKVCLLCVNGFSSVLMKLFV